MYVSHGLVFFSVSGCSGNSPEHIDEADLDRRGFFDHTSARCLLLAFLVAEFENEVVEAAVFRGQWEGNVNGLLDGRGVGDGVAG